ncbi:hypothetical protein ACEV74_22300 [Vibrio parahaemolyticus]|uniref:hypothetical protein n=1 Tax=Vibrio parahaemolyticus TaxID=670 RepID=UPI0011227454|nr:hypothetical protein [Vibrio parahaemolyticus]EIO4098045.1 hypothetical protein [Vibrio parahaemolyticus]EIY9802892.1 hypothetical protein [Vibrio parahaemolyticus]EJE4731080.1 hypothetical protein [Vibrio parahaemolyticus]MBE4169269.1 hypothetical protein [Vibrio parahaemolyticus]TNY95174.1 hypothetical protein CGK57_24130 [Vibrio parahaemolyticus]
MKYEVDLRDKKFLRKAFEHIKSAHQGIERKNYQQEAAYVSAVMGRLNGTIKDPKTSGTLEFKFETVVVNDRGPGAAESKYGADFAIVFNKKGVENGCSKAILGQAKNGKSDDLSKRERTRLIGQCDKMYKHTADYIVVEAPQGGDTGPMVRIGDQREQLKIGKSRISLEHYIMNKLVGCHHGDRRDDFIDAVQDSSLSKLEIITNGLDLDLDLTRGDRSLEP